MYDHGELFIDVFKATKPSIEMKDLESQETIFQCFMENNQKLMDACWLEAQAKANLEVPNRERRVELCQERVRLLKECMQCLFNMMDKQKRSLAWLRIVKEKREMMSS